MGDAVGVPYEFRAAAQITSVVDQAAELGVADVYFEGGEPTLAYPVVLEAAAQPRARA